MKSWIEFTNEIDSETCDQIIADYELFQINGAVGNCCLRELATEWRDNIGVFDSITTTMMDLAMVAYAKRYHELRNNI